MKEEGIVYGIDEDAIGFIVSSINNEGTPAKNFPVARGIHAKQGRDGKINFLFNVNNGLHYKERADGSVDIRETHRIQNVSEGAEIANIIPHIDSIPGKDVCGKTIPVSKIKKVTFKAGKNVRVSDDGLHFFSE